MQRLYALLLALFILALASPAALAGGITVAEEQQRAHSEMNRYRRMSRVPTAASSSALNTAARNHARYMVETGEWGHYETRTSSPYYIGYEPDDRAKRYGYSGSVTENYKWDSLGSTGTRTYLQVDNSMRWWLTAIYHRFPILDPRSTTMGHGPYYRYGKVAQALDFGRNYSAAGPMVQWPRPNATGIETSLSGESPNPIAQFDGSFPTGYPVSISWWRGTVNEKPTITMRKANGTPVEGYILTPHNDQLHYWATSVSFIPKQPLSYGTKYTVTFKGTYSPTTSLADGRAFSYTWSFTTMPRQGTLASATPGNGATGVARDPSITLSFTRPLRAYTLVNTPYKRGMELWSSIGVSLSRASDGSEVPLTIALPTTANTKVVNMKPSVQLAPNTKYRLTYRFGDAWGRPQSGSLYFTTGG